jgi:hypothetical protein
MEEDFFLKSLNGEINKKFLITSSGLEIKQDVKSAINVPLEKLVLVFNHRLIDDNKPLSSQGVVNNSIVLLRIVSDTVIHVETKENKRFDIPYLNSSTCKSIKEKIVELMPVGTAVDRIALIHKNKVLNNDKLLKEQNVYGNSIVYFTFDM